MKKPTRPTRTRASQRPNIPPSASLRAHLDALWQPTTLTTQDDATQHAALETITTGIAPLHALPIILAAYGAVSTEHHPRIDTILVPWLRAHHHADPLHELIRTRRLTKQQTQHALHWLAATGIDISNLSTDWNRDSFYRAYYYRDTTQQAELFVFFYPDYRRRTVQLLDFLIDHNPPWNGAIKEFVATRPRKPQDAIDEVLRSWNQNRPDGLHECDAETMAAIFGHALLCNHTSTIRLPSKMEAWRDDLVQYILSWVPADEMPDVTPNLLDSLLLHGQQPEVLSAYEDQVGYYLGDASGHTRFISRTTDSHHMEPDHKPPEQHR